MAVVLVSIFIPTYNGASFLPETVQSVIRQSYTHWELWLVDDCSTDGVTPSLLDDYAAQDSRIHVIHKERNEGFVPCSWNRVFSQLSGEFTLYMSQDDWLAPDCLEMLIQTQSAADADTVIANCVFTDGNQQRASFGPHSPAMSLAPRQAFARMLNYDIPGFALWRTSLIRHLGMPTDAWNADEGMQRLWALGSNRVMLCPAAMFYYRQTPDSITKGLRPYHLSGLNTQRALLRASLTHGIWWRYPLPVIRFAWQYLRSWRYLRRHLA